ncbi:hypothetical protein [Prosthecobacter algae]|uniref:hypothetical protein n=1 Tax=Prosthecobacter algae TaxID=1144682 RepID=UPI0031EE6CCE
MLFTKHWYARSVVELIKAAHIGACDLFPHPGLLEIGGTRVFARSKLTRKLRAVIEQIIKRAPRCGWSEAFVKDFTELWRVADGFLVLIDRPDDGVSCIPNQAARHFYLICGGAWHLVSSLGQTYGVEPETSLIPFERLLEYSGVPESWHDENLHKTNEELKRILDQMSAKLSLIHPAS